MSNATGLLVLAYGTPENMEDVRHYLTHIRHGNMPSDEAVEDLKARYDQIGGPSPLYKITVDQMKALEAELNSGDGSYRGYLGMKHWHPYIDEAIEQMDYDGITDAVAVILAPHYSTMSVAQYLGYVGNAVDELEDPINVLCVKSYHDEPLFIDALEETLRGGMKRVPEKRRAGVPVIFTAHSLPEKILEADDPYRDQLLATCELVAERFEDLNWSFAFTSQGETEDKWLGPTLAETLEEVASEGHKTVLAATVGFVTEHLETLYDFDIAGKKDAKKRGLAFYRAPALNTSPKFIAALAEVVRKAEVGSLANVVRLPGDELQAPTYPTYS